MKQNIQKLSYLLVVVFLLVACATTPEAIEPAPTLENIEVDEGNQAAEPTVEIPPTPTTPPTLPPPPVIEIDEPETPEPEPTITPEPTEEVVDNSLNLPGLVLVEPEDFGDKKRMQKQKVVELYSYL